MKFKKYEELTEELYRTYSEKYNKHIVQIRDNLVKLKKSYEINYEELAQLNEDLLDTELQIKNIEVEIKKAELMLKDTEYYVQDNKKQIQMFSAMRKPADDLRQYLNASDNNPLIDKKLSENRAIINDYKAKAKEIDGSLSKAKSTLREKQQKYNGILDQIKAKAKEMKNIKKAMTLYKRDIEQIYVSKEYLDNSYTEDANCPKAVKMTYLNPKLPSLYRKDAKSKRSNEQKSEEPKQKTKNKK